VGAGSPKAELGTFEMDDRHKSVTQHCYLVLHASIPGKRFNYPLLGKTMGKGMKTKTKTIKLFNF
jgi:hypothetical protein